MVRKRLAQLNIPGDKIDLARQLCSSNENPVPIRRVAFAEFDVNERMSRAWDCETKGLEDKA
jgi:hypothetical protein